jgi:hypothetical protein
MNDIMEQPWNNVGGKTEGLGEKFVPVPLYPPQICMYVRYVAGIQHVITFRVQVLCLRACFFIFTCFWLSTMFLYFAWKNLSDSSNILFACAASCTLHRTVLSADSECCDCFEKLVKC